MKTDNCYRLTCSLVVLVVGLTLEGSAWAAQKVGANCLTGGGTNCVAPIPDGSTEGITALNSTITIPAGSCPTVSRVCVATNIEHSARGDLTVQLLHGARTHTLVAADGNPQADISRAFVLETEFDGVNGAGPWNLSISDSTNGEYGALNNWTLGLCCGAGCGNGLVLVTPNGALQTTEAGGTAKLDVELTCPAFNQVTIPVSSSDTTEGTVAPAALVFTAANSQNPQTITVTGKDDALFDGNINYQAVLGTVAVGASFATTVPPADLYHPPSVFRSVGNLPDVTLVNLDNEAGTNGLRINNVSKAEGNSGSSALTFTVSLTPASAGPVTVNFATANGSATAGSDYTATSGVLTFSPGQTSKTISVPVRGDTLIEPNEGFLVSLSGASGATIADGIGVGTITNDDSPALRINNVSKAEGNSGSSALTFTVSLTPASTGPVTVNFATANGSATAGSDYTATSGALTFSPGQTSKTISVPVRGDTLIEPNEAFLVSLRGVSGATIADGIGVGTITNDDVRALRITDVKRGEGNSGSSAFTFTVTLSLASTNPVTVTYATANGSATAGSDYMATNGVLTFSPGQTSKTVTVNVTGDTTLEANETFLVNLSNVNGATIADAQGLGTILNDEGLVLRVTDVRVAEGNSSTKAFAFIVSLTQAAKTTVTVDYATANGTATVPGGDYAARSGTLTFGPGQASQTVVVNGFGDTVLEANETFFLNLSNASGATIFDDQGVGTILNDEGSLLRINDVSKAEGNSGTNTFIFTVTLSQASAGAVTVNYATANGSALAGSDYTAVPVLPLTFSAGQTSKTVVVNVLGNTTAEPNETFVVNLSGAVGATIFDGQGIGTITNDDVPSR